MVRSVQPCQISYSHDGIFASVGGFCLVIPEADDERTIGYLTALFAFPKKALYSTPPADAEDVKVYQATYLPASSWYRSLSAKDQLLIYDPDYPSDPPFNTWVLPSRPIHIEDVHHPILVMGKVCRCTDTSPVASQAPFALQWHWTFQLPAPVTRAGATTALDHAENLSNMVFVFTRVRPCPPNPPAC